MGTRGPALELLFERAGLPAFEISAGLAARYGGDLGLTAPRLYANFVASVDGVVAMPVGGDSGHISGHDEADHFVMGLLRACADTVLIGAGTFRKARRHLWHAETVFPAEATLFAELRRKLGLRSKPLLALVTASGDVDPAHPALRDALMFTTRAGETKLRGKLPPTSRLIAFDGDEIPLVSVVEQLRAEGRGLTLTEGGPSLVGGLIAEGLLDEIFLTTSPALFGRFDGDGRKSLTNGVDLALPLAVGTPLDLLSVRRHESHLFLRYGLRR